MITKQRYALCIITGIIVAIILSALFLSGGFRTLQQRLHDPLYGGKPPLSDIIILAIDDKSLQEIGRWPWNRTVFSQLLPSLASARVIGFDVAFDEPTQDDFGLAAAIQSNKNIILPVEFGSFSQHDGRTFGESALFPVDSIRRSARGLGIINIITDDDGITRAANNNIISAYPLFSQVLASEAGGTTALATDRMLLNFAGPPGTFQTISITDVIHHRGEYNFNNSIILIGATAPDLHDTYFVPTSQGVRMPGVEVHANLVQTILTTSFLTIEPSWVILLVIFFLSFFVSLTIARFHAWTSAGIAIALLILYIIVVVMGFERRFVIDLVFAPLSIALTYTSNLVNLFISEKRHKKQIFEAFNKYVSPTVINELLKHPGKLKLGGESRTITIFFSDIRGFTTVSERLSPEALVELLNEYLTAMTDIIMKHDGIVDKYMGDAIMAFWGAPLEQPDHALRACLASLEMRERLSQLQIKWTKEGLPCLNIGIGLNTGHAVVGNMGSHQRFDYTCMGDTINTGSRLEGLNKEYGTTIIASQFTYDALVSCESGKTTALPFVFRELDQVRVKGKKEPVTIYELVGKTDSLLNEKHESLSAFASGLRLYRQKRFKEAKAAFTKANKVYPDKTSLIYIDRCNYLTQHHPEKGWDRVWVMKTK